MNFLEFAHFDNNIVPFTEARISVATLALQYGLSVFGGIRGYKSTDGKAINIFRLRDHYIRFTRSASLIKISLPGDVEQLIQSTIELTKHNNPNSDCYYRPFAYKSDLSLGPSIAHPGGGFTIYMLPLENYFSKDTLSLCVSSWRRVSDSQIPARGKIGGAYVNSAIAKDEAVLNGYDDAIMMNEHGKVGEASAANLFMVRDGVIITPGVSSDILEGITRRTVFEIARDLGIPIMEREMDRSELYISDELFLCGTAAQISPVTHVDKREIGDPARPITTKLRAAFEDAVRGRNPQYANWLTRVDVG